MKGIKMMGMSQGIFLTFLIKQCLEIKRKECEQVQTWNRNLNKTKTTSSSYTKMISKEETQVPFSLQGKGKLHSKESHRTSCSRNSFLLMADSLKWINWSQPNYPDLSSRAHLLKMATASLTLASKSLNKASLLAILSIRGRREKDKATLLIPVHHSSKRERPSLQILSTRNRRFIKKCCVPWLKEQDSRKISSLERGRAYIEHRRKASTSHKQVQVRVGWRSNESLVRLLTHRFLKSNLWKWMKSAWRKWATTRRTSLTLKRKSLSSDVCRLS